MQKTTADQLEQALSETRLRNQQRVAEVIKGMGRTYACHPANMVAKDSVRTRFMAYALQDVVPDPNMSDFTKRRIEARRQRSTA